MDGNEEREALRQVAGVAQAALIGLLGHMRPVITNRIRVVLERNETIVTQTPEALEHLSNEIVDALFPARDLDFDS